MRTPLIIPEEIYEAVENTQGIYYEHVSGIDRKKLTNDLLDEKKALQQAEILKRFTNLNNKRVLEVGTGLAINLISWIKHYNADMWGVEPDSFGFGSSFKLARQLASVNKIDPERIINAAGESLPFIDESFDVVFSANVLEHTNDPVLVVNEAMRVLRPNGVLQFIYPNHHSYFDGHYGVFHPPILTKRFFPWYVKTFFGRDPEFATTLRTELNVGWTKQQIKALSKQSNLELLSLGKEVFIERMNSLNFAAWGSLGRLQRILQLLANRHLRRLLSHIIIGLRGWTPIILTMRKLK